MLEFAKIAAHTVTVPEVIDYKGVRLTLNSGLLKKSDVVEIAITVTDSDNKIKYQNSDKVLLKEYPEDKEILGVVSLSFNDSPIIKE
jgi:hypothetical protein